MKNRMLFATLAIPATTAGLFAQDTIMLEKKKAAEAITIAQGAVGMIGLSGEPGNVRFMAQELTINGRPVANAPYSADETTESVQTLADGTRIANSTTSKVYRDSQGRTRRELSFPAIKGSIPSHTMISISDPVAGVNYTLDPQQKVAHKMPSFAMTTGSNPEMTSKLKAEMQSRIEAGNTTIRSNTMEYRVVASGGSSNAKREDLPSTMMEGVNVTGARETTVIETGAMGNDRPITISSERWYSPELQMEVKSVRNDPRMGTTTHSVTNISRSEPDATLFQVPSDYRLEDPKAAPHMQTFEFHSTEHKF
jgi:hypothetical protein